MAPTLRTRPKPKLKPVPKARTAKKPRRTTHFKTQKVVKKPNTVVVNQEVLSSSCPKLSCSSKVEDGSDFEVLDTSTSTHCSTPKAERFRIPEIVTCPPAPRKKRVLSPSSNCSNLQRTPIAFFAPPDLELFFVVALRDIPA